MKAIRSWLFIITLIVPTINVHAWPIPDTGQTKCYWGGTETPCPSPGQTYYGQDGSYNINSPSYSKLDSIGNTLTASATAWAMVRDNVTGLIWENKTSNNSIHDGSKTFTWCDKNTATNGGNQGACVTGTGIGDTEAYITALNDSQFGSFSDWRLPTIKELSSLVNSSVPSPGPTIDKNWFSNTGSGSYCSSTTSANLAASAWFVNFGDGSVYVYNKTYGCRIRAVRSGLPRSSLADNGDGTVTDSDTGLMWQKATAPGAYTWKNALSYCENLTLAGYTDWRLPNRNELQSLMDYSRKSPAIDILLASNTALDSYYYSSTSAASDLQSAWIVDPNDGSLQYLYGNKGYSCDVRAVRLGQIKGTIRRGDINYDGQVNLTDAVLALKVIASVSSQQIVYKKADVDGDGKIGMEEAIYVLQQIAAIRTADSGRILPLANAGASQDVATGTLITLDGSSSIDADCNLLTYRWTFASKPKGSSAVLSSATIVKPTFTPDIAGVYFVNLVVNNGWVDSFPATVAVTASNVPPVDMVLIPAGGFWMGTENTNEGNGTERPYHHVALGAFYLDKYEITKGFWNEVYTWATAHGYIFDNIGFGTTVSHPVNTVSWYDVVKWLNARSEKEGRTPVYYTDSSQTKVYRTEQVDIASGAVNWSANGYRLPTEAEWEYAARAGTTTQFYTGDSISTLSANYNSSGTTPVGSFDANPWGLYDMEGNVWEWMWDWYGTYEALSVTNPRGPESGTYRVNRGGSWKFTTFFLRSAARMNEPPSYGGNDIGFRCARSQP